MNYKDILADIKDKKTSPIYFLVGEEPYYIDKICNEFGNKLIKKEERDFNQVIFYGKDTNIEEIILECKQFPFGAEKRPSIFLASSVLTAHFAPTQESNCPSVVVGK